MSKFALHKRNKIVLVAVGTLAVAVGLWFVLISPLRAKAAQLARRAAEARAEVVRGQKSVAAAEQIARELAAVTNRLTAAEAAMASGDLYAWMIQTMNRFKQAYAVDIPQIGRETPCEVGMFPQYPYRAASFVVRGVAYYHEFGKFLADFENNFPAMRVQNLELEPSTVAKEEEPERLQFKMEVVTLVKPVAL
jgi:hypothetical protein